MENSINHFEKLYNTTPDITERTSAYVHSAKLLKKAGLLMLGDFTQDEIQYRLKHYFKFTFTRDPYSRLYSAWRDKVNILK